MTSLTATFGEIQRTGRSLSWAKRADRVVVVGAGIAGLSAAITLATRGCAVRIIEKAAKPGGKLRQVEVNGRCIDGGPTVLTMRWVFQRLFDEAGLQFDDFVKTKPAEILCRHAWQDGSRLDLFAERRRSIEAIAAFSSPAEAKRYRRFAETAERLYRALEPTFIDASKPNALKLAFRMAGVDAKSLTLLNPMETLWQALCKHFTDPRLRQLFARYATYSGASPFEAAATLMLISHAEQAGVWTVQGGMIELARGLERLAASLGVEVRTNCEVQSLVTSAGRVSAVELPNGERLSADAVVVNADAVALAEGLLGNHLMGSVSAVPRSRRSISAITTAVVARARGFPLSRHNVFFSRNYRAEFDDIFKLSSLPREPTVYICAQDRPSRAPGNEPAHPAERALVLINAPPNGDLHTYQKTEIEQCWERTQAVLRRCGLELDSEPLNRKTETPNTFHNLFPATGGALYGRSSHGWAAAFQRPGSRTLVPGLYLAGGSVHPGAGVPIAALSGRQAAVSLLDDLASIRKSYRVAIFGGMSTR